jgi:hypothetical protein
MRAHTRTYVYFIDCVVIEYYFWDVMPSGLVNVYHTIRRHKLEDIGHNLRSQEHQISHVLLLFSLWELWR